MPGARLLRWDIYEEHLDEAAFLWGMWEQALAGASYALHDVIVGPEERLLAHLDGLVLGGQAVAHELLLPALAEAQPGRVAAAAWALLQAEDADHLDAVIESAVPETEPPALAALARAFELCDRQDFPKRLLPRFETSPLPRQVVIAGALAGRQGAAAAPAGGIALDALLASPDPALRIAGLRALRTARDPNLTRRFATQLEDALSSEHAASRETAIEAGVALGVNAAWDACRRASRTQAASRLPLSVLALGGDPGDAQSVLAILHAPELRKDALWALGFAGTLEAAEAVLAFIADEELGKLAADSFVTITGAALASGMLKRGETDNSPPSAAEDEAPPPELGPEDDLPAPDPERVRAFWEKAKPRFKPGVRHVLGQPASVHSVQSALAISPMWRRRLFSLEVAARADVDVDARQWARAQLRNGVVPADLRMDRPLPALAKL